MTPDSDANSPESPNCESGLLLAGIRVVDLAGEPAEMTGRLLADLGAEVIRVIPPVDGPRDGAGDDPGDDTGEAPARRDAAEYAWGAGKSVLVCAASDPAIDALLGGADIVIDTPGWRGVHQLDPGRAPNAVWVSVTPFGKYGPRSSWRASDIGVMASSGNMYCTGDRDRAPLRGTEPISYAHSGPEAAFAALSALWSRYPHRVDVSMQEVVLVANMVGIDQFAKTGVRGARHGANIGRTNEIWPCADGYVVFGLRGGKARVPSLQLITRLVTQDGIEARVLTERDWTTYSHVTATDEELRAIEVPIGEYFLRHTVRDLFAIAVKTNLMLAPVNAAKEILADEQLEARKFFEPLGVYRQFPGAFVQVRSADGAVRPATPTSPARQIDAAPAWGPRPTPPRTDSHGVWEGTKILELGSGAAGPIATRYFAEHGATVLRIESRSRPDFLRTYALGPKNPHGLDGSPMFDGLNPGKLGFTLNLKSPRGLELARRLIVEWADAVSENFAPKAMLGFGLNYDAVVGERPDLVMISACMNGQTGPTKDYPGFGSQGAALAGFNHHVGWPDRLPVGPFGTITDSLAPRFVATAMASGLLYRRRTGKGAYFDLSQVEAGIWSLSPWLLEYQSSGNDVERMGNRSLRAVPHGAFMCTGKDRWVTIAIWTDDEWQRLAEVIGAENPSAKDASLSTFAQRAMRVDEVEGIVATWTALRIAEDVAAQLQALGIESVPVADFGDVCADPQLASRDHFVTLEHPLMGEGVYARNGFRLSGAPSGYQRTSPLLGQDNEYVLGEILGLTQAEQAQLLQDGALE